MSVDLLDLVTLWTPFTSEVEAGPVAANFLEALWSRLRGLSELAELTEVRLGKPKPGEEFPYLLFHSIDDAAEINTSASFYGPNQMQYDVYTLDADDAQRLGSAARLALLTGPELVFADGYEMTRWLVGGRKAHPDNQPGPGGETVWRYRFDFVHLIGEG